MKYTRLKNIQGIKRTNGTMNILLNSLGYLKMRGVEEIPNPILS